MMKILNLTQYPGTPEQGVIDLTGDELVELRHLLTFGELPTTIDVVERAEGIAALAAPYLDIDYAMIGGPPFLMSYLVDALLDVGVIPLFTFSRLESTEVTGADGAVRKTSIFRHVGFVSAAMNDRELEAAGR